MNHQRRDCKTGWTADAGRQPNQIMAKTLCQCQTDPMGARVVYFVKALSGEAYRIVMVMAAPGCSEQPGHGCEHSHPSMRPCSVVSARPTLASQAGQTWYGYRLGTGVARLCHLLAGLIPGTSPQTHSFGSWKSATALLCGNGTSERQRRLQVHGDYRSAACAMKTGLMFGLDCRRSSVLGLGRCTAETVMSRLTA